MPGDESRGVEAVVVIVIGPPSITAGSDSGFAMSIGSDMMSVEADGRSKDVDVIPDRSGCATTSSRKTIGDGCRWTGKQTVL